MDGDGAKHQIKADEGPFIGHRTQPTDSLILQPIELASHSTKALQDSGPGLRVLQGFKKFLAFRGLLIPVTQQSTFCVAGLLRL